MEINHHLHELVFFGIFHSKTYQLNELLVENQKLLVYMMQKILLTKVMQKQL